MSAQDNAEVIRSGYEAFSKGDMDTVAKLFDHGIRWHVSGRSQLAGTYEGHDAVFGFFTRLMGLTGNTFAIEIHDLLASEDHVVVLARETATREGRSLDANEVHVWHLAGGHATEFWGISQDAYASDAFFA